MSYDDMMDHLKDDSDRQQEHMEYLESLPEIVRKLERQLAEERAKHQIELQQFYSELEGLMNDSYNTGAIDRGHSIKMCRYIFHKTFLKDKE